MPLLNTTLSENTQLQTQVGGSHYKDLMLQPLDFFRANLSHTSFCDHLVATATKYLWRKKQNRVEDLQKAIHYLQILVEEIEQHRSISITQENNSRPRL